MTIQVILADDQPLVRAGLRMLIEQTPDIDVAGEAGTGAEAVQRPQPGQPSIRRASAILAAVVPKTSIIAHPARIGLSIHLSPSVRMSVTLCDGRCCW